MLNMQTVLKEPRAPKLRSTQRALPMCEHLQKLQLFIKKKKQHSQYSSLNSSKSPRNSKTFFLDVSKQSVNGCMELNLAAVPTSFRQTAFL